jgi:peptidoglycan/xylan/chitin deacetylase (PgdA/CDA1 family)
MNGNNWGCIYDYADKIIAAHNAGWTLGNHGYSHAHMGSLTWDQAHNELWLVEQAFIKILGLKPLYFRPPYGETSDTLMAVLANRGYKKAFLWSDDTQDSDGATPAFSENIYTQIAKTYPQPHLVLNHETIQTTSSQVMPYAVPLLKKAGYKLVAVDTCLGSGGEWPYEYVGAPQQRDSTWTCVAPLRN